MFNKTVDSITKVFTQAIKDLEALEAAKKEEIGKYTTTRQKLAISEQEAQNEIDRAQAVRTKLLSIVG